MRKNLKISVNSFLEVIVILYFFTMILLSYLAIGKILPFPQIRSDISIHLKNAEILLLNPSTYNAYPYLGFHLILSTLYTLFNFNQGIVYQVTGLLVFANVSLGMAVYKFLKKLFSSSLPAFFGTLILLSGNSVVFIDDVIQYIFNTSTNSFRIFNLIEPLLFTSRYNLSSYILIQFSPFTISIALICFLLSHVLTTIYCSKNLKIMRLFLVFLFILATYLIHPLYAFLVNVLLLFLVLVKTCIMKEEIVQRYIIRNIIPCIIIAGFIPTLIAYMAYNTSQTYKFQSLMFSVINMLACSCIMFFLMRINLIKYIVQKFCNVNVTVFKYLFPLSLTLIWIYSLLLISIQEDFNAWNLINQPTPILLYPAIIGIGPLIISIILSYTKNEDVRILSWICLLLPLIFVYTAPIVDFINFNILGFRQINGNVFYSGITSGRLLALANFMYNITSGSLMGFAIEQSFHRRLNFLIGVFVLFLLLILFSVLSLKYWHAINELLSRRVNELF